VNDVFSWQQVANNQAKPTNNPTKKPTIDGQVQFKKFELAYFSLVCPSEQQLNPL
jgi:hypothetical protein